MQPTFHGVDAVLALQIPLQQWTQHDVVNHDLVPSLDTPIADGLVGVYFMISYRQQWKVVVHLPLELLHVTRHMRRRELIGRQIGWCITPCYTATARLGRFVTG